MERWFTHRLDSRTKGDRHHKVKTFWRILAEYFLIHGNRLKIRYWPGDLDLPEHLAYSAYGIRTLQKYVISNRVTEDDTMEIIVGPINNEVIDLVLGETTQPFSSICPWFDLSILDQQDNILFYSHDHGAGTLMKLTEDSLQYLAVKGIDFDYLIEQPEIVTHEV